MIQNNNIQNIVLVVEDEPVISRICQRTLKADGFDVDIAFNGIEAKVMADKKNYDLCLTDIRTPQMNGIELFEYLELKHPRLAERTIFTTGDVLNSDISIFLKKVKKPFLAKPFTPDELRNIISEMFEKQKEEIL
jgi:DNA-binding NtrC family response regulator